MNSFAPALHMGSATTGSATTGIAAPPFRPGPANLSGQQKAAIIVRALLNAGGDALLSELPDELQTVLTQQMAGMNLVDKATRDAVIEEFLQLVEDVGLSFPEGLHQALELLDGHLSSSAATRLRRMAGASMRGDPWIRLAGLDGERLLPVLEEESIEVGAVLLSKLSVSKAAELLGRLPGDRARRIAYAVSLTGNVDPDTVLRIGHSLAAQLDAEPDRAFDSGPVERVGAILNYSAAATRDDVLQGLEETDAAFAEEVRRAIFTFANIPQRLEPRDIPKIVKAVAQATLVTAIAGATGPDQAAAEFILSNMSQRMAQSLREEAAEMKQVKPKDAEAAMTEVIDAIRGLEASGDIFLVAGDE